MKTKAGERRNKEDNNMEDYKEVKTITGDFMIVHVNGYEIMINKSNIKMIKLVSDSMDPFYNRVRIVFINDDYVLNVDEDYEYFKTLLL